MTMGRVGIRLMLFVAVAATIGCDRVTKHVAATALADAPRHSYLADTIRLEYVENTGAFLGLGADWSPAVRTVLFGVGNGLLLLVLTVLAVRGRWPPRALVGVAFFAAGGVSNLVDRIATGAVVDFMNVGIGPLRTGIFNVADMAIMLGVGLLVFDSLQPSAGGSRPASG